MSIYGGPDITTDGLVLCLDPSISKSYPGTGTAWNDLSGNNRSATLFNSPTFDSNNRGSFFFDGTNSYIELTKNSYDITDEYTISFWVKRTSGTGVFLYIGTTSTTGMYCENYFNRDLVTWFFGPSGAQSLTWPNQPLSITSWTNIVFTVTTSTKTINRYRNGVLFSTNPTVLTNSINLPSATGTWRIRNNTQNWSGYISSLQIYNKILSGNDILQNYNVIKARYVL